MSKHEHFEELCALAVIGELAPDQHQELSRHLRECVLCRSRAREFVNVVEHLPIKQVELSDRALADLEESAGAESFLKRAANEGVLFSKAAFESVRPHRSAWNLFTRPAFAISPAVAALAVVFVAGGLWFASRNEPTSVRSAEPVATKPNIEAPQPAVVDSRLSKANQQITSLRKEIDSLDGQLVTARNHNESTDSQRRQQSQTITSLEQKIAEGEKILSQATASARKAESERDEMVASLIEQRNQVQELEADLRTAKAAVEQERQLNAAAHDVRELMGARKLHIVDVYDAENDAGSEKSFGRVIYTEGKSLIFYAFDLDQRRRGRKVTFQAWGQSDGQREFPRNLGVFYIDDEVQKRWVLKVNDIAKLKAIDTVFVTVESHKEAEKPSRERFLQAYLGSRANHP